MKTEDSGMPKRTSSAKNSINCRVSSFRRVCAMACVNDGYIGDDEIDALKYLGQALYKLDSRQIDTVMEECNINSSNNEYLFYDVPTDIEEIAVDIYNIISIIYADKIISENEKEAFNIMLIIYGFRRTVFHKPIFDKVRLAFEDHEEDKGYDIRKDKDLMRFLATCLRRSGHYHTDKDRGVIESAALRVRSTVRSVIDKRIVKLIVDKFKYRKIRGPMLMGAKNFLIYGVNEYKYKRESRNSFLTKIAIGVFLLSAGVLYMGTAFPEWFLTLQFLDKEACFAFGIISLLLSIEWIIFMKERMYENNKSETEGKKMSKILVVLVVVAVVIDMSFGMLELGSGEITDLPEVIIKFCSAIFLGGLCFYVGKCLELYNDHIEQDNEYINRKIDELDGVSRKINDNEK